MALLGGDDGGGAAAEGTIVNSGNGRVVMREFRSELRSELRRRNGSGLMGGTAAMDGVEGSHFHQLE